MLRRSCRWLDSQPRRNVRELILTKPGSASAGRGSTPATATATLPPDADVLVGAEKIPRIPKPSMTYISRKLGPGPAAWPATPGCKVIVDVKKTMPSRPGSAGHGSTPATAVVTFPPDGGVLVRAAKIPRIPKPRTTCILQKLGPAGWPATPECKVTVDVEKGMPSNLPLLPAKLQSTRSNISFVWDGLFFKHSDGQALRPALAQVNKVRQAAGINRRQMAQGTCPGSAQWRFQRSEHADVIHDGKTTCNNEDSLHQHRRTISTTCNTEFRQGKNQTVLINHSQMPRETCVRSSHWSFPRSERTVDVLHDEKTTCNNQDPLQQHRGALSSGITTVPLVSTCRAQVQAIGGIIVRKDTLSSGTGVSTCRRFCSKASDWKDPLPAPGPGPDNVLEVLKPSVTCETKPFQLNVDKTVDLLSSVDQDKKVVRNALDLKSLKAIYDKKVRQACAVRGMICHHSVKDPECKLLHNRYKRITGKFPIYMTCLDLMENLTVTHDKRWTPSLDSYSHQHVFVHEDWNRSYNTTSGYTFYDKGLRMELDAGKGYIRGECDGSYNPKTKFAKISKMFWKEDQVLSATVFYGIPCTSSIEAEALAMYFLLKTGIKYEKLEVSSDSQFVINVLKGYQTVSRSDNNYDLIMVLRYLRKCYSEIVPRWQNRENLLFVDSLLRGKEMHEFELEHTKSMLIRWADALSGNPIYIVSRHKHPEITSLADKRCMLTDFQEVCFCEVQQDSDKMSAIWHIISSLEAQKIRVVIDNFETRSDLLAQYGELFGAPKVLFKEGSSSVLNVPASTNTNFERTSIRLVILFDAEAATTYIKEDQDYYLVLLSTPKDRPLITKLNIPSFSPLSFVSVHKHTNHEKMGTSATNAASKGTQDTNTADTVSKVEEE